MSAELDSNRIFSRPYTDYTLEYKQAAVAQYHANEGNLKRTATELNLPVPTLRYWIHSGVELKPQNIEAIDSKLEKTGHKLIDSIYNHDLENATLQAKATAFGIVIDKMQLLRGQPTTINANLDVKEVSIVLSSSLAEFEETDTPADDTSTSDRLALNPQSVDS